MDCANQRLRAENRMFSHVEASRNGFGLLATLPGDIPGFWMLCPHWAALSEALLGSLAATSPIPS